ncbi:multidrug effflux MFS transporter [Sphingomonas sp. LaA6.9]|uniref:multidrug effflux MFS transporter n=1 Tax=Sphingomonas sp. LaA6.9 TaxID=2919914 RepID=UPI001F4F7F58|nr:multidrug effflux MFS transporter [Sphingomonas sp. LaA6.9]MCJ8156825.1 multidrug effflux MFS transporter [Sphingomonas sp. LaA6.9]
MNAPAHPEVATSLRPGFREFVAMMAAIMAMVAFGIDSMLPALPAIGDSLSIPTENDRQYVIAAFMIGFGVAQLFVGTLSDRFGRRVILLTALAAYAVFSVIAALAPTFETLLIARVLQGASSAGGRTLVASIVRDRYVGRQMARVMSLAFIVFMAAPILAPSAGQLILLVAPWRWIFVVLGLTGVGLLIWVALRLPETLAPERRIAINPTQIRRSCGKILRDRQSVGYTVALAFLTGALYGFINSVQQVFADTFGAPHLLAPLFASVAVTMALGSLINSRLVVRLGMRFIGHWALIGFTVLSSIHLLVATSGYESIWTFALLQSAAMGCFGLSTANFGALAMEHVGEVAGTASSLQGAFSTVNGAIIGITIGQFFDGTTVPLYTGFFLCGLGALGAILICERGRLFHHPA